MMTLCTALALALSAAQTDAVAASAEDDRIFERGTLTAEGQPVSVLCGASRREYILEVNGGGLVVGDFDLDGALDLVVVNGSSVSRVRAGEPCPPSRLLLGDAKGGFRNAGSAWALPGGSWAMGGSAADLDRDGDLDLVITEWGPNRVFLNDAGRGFKEARLVAATDAGGGAEAVVAPPADAMEWSTSCAFLDYDGDGHLDLFIVNYLSFTVEDAAPPGGPCRWKGHDVMCGPEGMLPQRDRLLRGLGDGTFVDATESAGIASTPPCFGLGVMTLDYDQDGDTDLYVSNDSMPNHLWENQGDGTFLEVGLRRGVSHDANGNEQAGMGIACGDVNRDGREDLFVTNFSGERNSLYRSSRGTGFREAADRYRLGGPSIPRLGWGTGLHDYNLDGWLDVSVVNGHVYPAADREGTDTTYAQLDQLFLGSATGRFAEAPLSHGVPGVGRASATADFDGDGDLDMVVACMDGPAHYLDNKTKAGVGRRWLQVQLGATESHPDAIGARVEVAAGEATWSAEVRTTGGFQSGCSTDLHFGLGAVDRIDALTIHWPSGQVQVLEDVEVDQRLGIREPAR